MLFVADTVITRIAGRIRVTDTVVVGVISNACGLRYIDNIGAIDGLELVFIRHGGITIADIAFQRGGRVDVLLLFFR